jgi:hypothetical protein
MHRKRNICAECEYIAKSMGRNKSTISRELSRNTGKRGSPSASGDTFLILASAVALDKSPDPPATSLSGTISVETNQLFLENYLAILAKEAIAISKPTWLAEERL